MSARPHDGHLSSSTCTVPQKDPGSIGKSDVLRLQIDTGADFARMHPTILCHLRREHP